MDNQIIMFPKPSKCVKIVCTTVELLNDFTSILGCLRIENVPEPQTEQVINTNEFDKFIEFCSEFRMSFRVTISVGDNFDNMEEVLNYVEEM